MEENNYINKHAQLEVQFFFESGRLDTKIIARKCEFLKDSGTDLPIGVTMVYIIIITKHIMSSFQAHKLFIVSDIYKHQSERCLVT